MSLPDYAERALDAIDDIEIGAGRNAPNLAAIRAHLVSAGIKESDIDWMTASCPSLRTAHRYYPKRTP